MKSKLKKTKNLHGDFRVQSDQALLLIDVINDLEFPGGDQLAAQVNTLSHHIAALVKKARLAGVPILYVNDNFQRWKSDFRSLLKHCLRQGSPGFLLAHRLKPRASDYFILKPEKSAFYHTPLALLLQHLGVKKLILAGLTTDSCIYLTACDAHMRDYHLSVPQDCVAAIKEEEHWFFLKQMEEKLNVNINVSTKLHWNVRGH